MILISAIREIGGSASVFFFNALELSRAHAGPQGAEGAEEGTEEDDRPGHGGSAKNVRCNECEM